MISDNQESNLSNAYSRSSKKRQDRENPMVINIHDGRLMPNTPRLRIHKDYRVYTGPIDASEPDRMKWVAGALKQRAAVVTNSRADEDIFDLGAASKDDILVFANENYGKVLDPQTDIRTLRKIVMQLAEQAAAAEPV